MTVLLPATTITAAISTPATTPPLVLNGQPRNLAMQATFTYGSGGTSVDAYVQTTFDGGATWTDIANFSFTTSSGRTIQNVSSQAAIAAAYPATDGSITANTAKDGVIGPQLRVKYKSSGAYAGGTTLRVDVAADQLPAFP